MEHHLRTTSQRATLALFFLSGLLTVNTGAPSCFAENIISVPLSIRALSNLEHWLCKDLLEVREWTLSHRNGLLALSKWILLYW